MGRKKKFHQEQTNSGYADTQKRIPEMPVEQIREIEPKPPVEVKKEYVFYGTGMHLFNIEGKRFCVDFKKECNFTVKTKNELLAQLLRKSGFKEAE